MEAYKQPVAGQSVEMPVSKNARSRIVAGLAWDETKGKSSPFYFPKQVVASLGMIIRDPRRLKYFMNNNELIYQKEDGKGRETDDPLADLDLSCFAFDATGNFKDWVDPTAEKAIDASSKMYHSGENMSGTYALDDEEIHIELKDMEGQYAHFFIIAESDCVHQLKSVHKARVRLADSMSNQNFITHEFTQAPVQDGYAFVFCHIFHKNGAWHLKNISEYVPDTQDWSTYLKKYL